MGQAEVLQGVRQMRLEALLDRRERGELNQEEAGEMLGISERTFRGWRDRCQSARRIAASCLSVVPRRLRRSRSKKDGDISRLGRFISRLGRGKFPVSPATGIGSQALDQPHYFRSRRARRGEIRALSVEPGICPKRGRGGT